MQRVGRKGHAQYRVVVQDSRFSPKSGRVVAHVGNYNPHAKTAVLDSHKLSAYLKNGAQPSDRVAQLLKAEGVKLPKWVAKPTKKKRAIRNPEKLRRNQPKDAAPRSEEPAEAPEQPAPAAEEAPAEQASTHETPVEPEKAEESAPTEETAQQETPAAEESKT